MGLMLVATLAAVAAAAMFAAATALLHRSAGIVSARIATSGTAPPAPQVGPAASPLLFRRFVAGTARHPLWLLGMLGELAGFGLHALALREGPLTLVQPLLVTGVVFALPLRQLIEGRRPGRVELVWAAVLAAGLALFFLAATPAQGTAKGPDPLPTTLAVLGIGGGALVCAWLGRRADGPRAAAVLGAGAGLAFAGVAGLLKEATAELSRGLGALFGDWPVYGLAAIGVAGLLLSQLAFRAAPLSASLPALTTVDPIASLVIGVAVFDEPFRRTIAAVSGEVAGLCLVMAAAIAITRRRLD
jgi:hypothetical protein